mgnify:CR=1 FL=1
MKKVVYLTFDIEPFWVNIPVRHSKDDWETIHDASLERFHEILSICDEVQVKATFFFVAEWARLNPGAVTMALSKGHTIGSHSMFHDDMTTLDDQAVLEDMVRSKETLEGISNIKVKHYRAPSFSLLPKQFRLLSLAGYEVDSSSTSAGRIRGGDNFDGTLAGNALKYVTLTGFRIFSKEFTILGGGYLRLVPPILLRFATRWDLGNMIYLHPIDFETAVARYPFLSFSENLRKRIRIGSMRKKIHILSKAYELNPM